MSNRAASRPNEGPSSRLVDARRAAKATRRYSAPLSSRDHPNALATARLTVPLPDPEGPSMVMTGTACMDCLQGNLTYREANRLSQRDKAGKRSRHVGYVPDGTETG